MIDRRLRERLHLPGFVFHASVRGLFASVLLPSGLASGFVCGCSPRSASGPADDTLTSGRIQVVCEARTRDLMERERSAFLSLYPRAQIDLRAGSSRAAISALFAAECDLAAIARELEPEERQAAVRGGLKLEGYRFARDAIVVVVHSQNPLENLAVDDLARIYRGEIARWSELGGPAAPIVPVVQPPELGISEAFAREVLGDRPPIAPSLMAESDSSVMASVRQRRHAIGYVSLAAGDSGVKVLRIASLAGLPYRKPDLESVHRGDYPLTRYFNLFVRSDGRRLAHGLVTFVTSYDGQKLVRDAGLVPTTVPLRFVRRSPMLGTH